MSFSQPKSLDTFQGNSVTTVFVTSIYALTSDQIIVSITDSEGVETIKDLGIDYTLANIGNDDNNAVRVTMLEAPNTGETLRVLRRTPTEQTLEISSGGFDPNVFEAALDLIVMMIQENATDFSRALRVFDPDIVTVDLPLPEAGKVLMGNPTSDGYVNGPDAEDIEAAATYASTASGAADAAEVAQTAAEAAAAGIVRVEEFITSSGALDGVSYYEFIGFDPAYYAYRFTLLGLQPSVSDDALSIRVRTASGLVTGAMVYKSARSVISEAGTVAGAGSSGNDRVVAAVSLGATEALDVLHGYIFMQGVDADQTPRLDWRLSYQTDAGGLIGASGWGWCSDYSANTGVRIYFDGGNISAGEILVSGLRRS